MKKDVSFTDLFNEYKFITNKLNYNLSDKFIENQRIEFAYIYTQIEDKLTIDEYTYILHYCIGFAYDNDNPPEIIKKFFFGKLKQKKLVKFINKIKQTK